MRTLVMTIGFVLGAMSLTGCVEGRFFYPENFRYSVPAGEYEDLAFESVDGTKLHAWFIPARTEAKGTVIYFHGNSRNISGHLWYADWLPDYGYNVFTFDYRGFGKSEGTPTIDGAVLDGIAAIRYIRTRPDVDPDRLLVFGQSMGDAVATTVVGRHQPAGVQGVFLDCPFASYPRIVGDQIRKSSAWAWPVSWLSLFMISGRNNPIRYVDDIAPRPLMIMHGMQDPLIPYPHSESLFAKAKQPKTLLLIGDEAHVSALRNGNREKYKRLIADFFDMSLNRPHEN